MRCEGCGYDRAVWGDGDLQTTLPIAEALMGEYGSGLPGDAIAAQVDRVRAALALVTDASSAHDAAHVLQHEVHAIGRVRASLGAASPPAIGEVRALHRSGGGVPKLPVDRVEVTRAGISGDVQNDRRHHGRPFQALSLWSLETIGALRDEGHPISPGLAGENITVSGIDWPSLRPGALVEIGGVLCEISSYATPCAKNADWFVDGDFRRMDQDRHPGWGRLYAWVLRPGRIAVGDAVVVEPPRS